MATKKYISLDKLNKYHGKLVEVIDAKDQSILSQAQSYADGLAENYDAAGAAAAVQANLDAEVARAQGKEAEALAAAQGAQKSANDLSAYVGTIPDTANAKDVVAYVDEKTAGIATSENLEALAGRVTQAENDIDAIEADYLKGSDKTEVLEAVTTETNRATAKENELAASIKAVSDDYLKAADKQELTDTINDNKAILDAVKEDVDAFFKDADMTESAKDTLKELQAYIASDESGAAAMAESIQKNAQDITGVAGRVTTLESDMAQAKTDIDNAEAKIAELEDAIGEGGNVAEQIAAAVKVEEDARKAADTTLQGNIDAVAGRVTTLEGEMDAVEGSVATKAEQADLTAAVGRISTAEGKVTTLEGKMTTAEGEIDTLQSEMDAVEAKAAANETAIGTLNTTVAGKAAQSALEAEITRATAAENANKALIEEFVEASDEDINGIFTA